MLESHHFSGYSPKYSSSNHQKSGPNSIIFPTPYNIKQLSKPFVILGCIGCFGAVLGLFKCLNPVVKNGFPSGNSTCLVYVPLYPFEDSKIHIQVSGYLADSLHLLLRMNFKHMRCNWRWIIPLCSLWNFHISRVSWTITLLRNWSVSGVTRWPLISIGEPT